MSDLQAVVVPKDLYYQEYAYVRRLEALVLKAEELINNMAGHEGAEGFSVSTRALEREWDELCKIHKEKTRV